MKNFLRMGFAMLIGILTYYNVSGQNPNWTLPSQYFHPSTGLVIDLPVPQGGSLPTEYTGLPSVALHNSYTDSEGNILFFIVDGAVYDKNGRLVGHLQEGSTHVKRGFNEMLILPMGNSCSRFAILYSGSPDYTTSGWESYSTGGRTRFYMSTYDMNAENPYEEGIGSLDGMTQYESYKSALDISKRDGSDVLINPPGSSLYNFTINIDNGKPVAHQGSYLIQIQVASSSLIDNCFYYVFVIDGKHLIRYKLDKDGLHWDDYKFDMGIGGGNTPNRTEMEMIRLANGNYRIAVPVTESNIGPGLPLAIKIYDLDSSFEVASEQTINLTDANHNRAFTRGLEFDKTGRYLYFTHEPNADLPNSLDVWDVQTNDYAANFNVPSGFTPFEYSYIERYDEKLYVVSSNAIGELSNASNPDLLGFNSSIASITNGYGNNLWNNDPNPPNKKLQYRTILPDQIDDADYGDFAERSCDCCKTYAYAGKTSSISYEATESGTWTYVSGNNPWGAISGETIYIRDKLVIPAGIHVDIQGMDFRFGPDARAIVKRGDNENSGGHLSLNNGTVFSADFRCSDKNFSQYTCNDPNNSCDDREMWQGVRVEGQTSDHTQSTQNQAVFAMDNKSMIEYAKIGVRAGHESLSGYGGGRLRIQNSIFKDNETGIQFDDYSRLESNNDEAFNLSRISFNTFKTTDEWLSNYLPKAHINVLNSSGLKLLGNIFENTNSVHEYDQRGIGVKLYDSRVIVSWNCKQPTHPCPPESVVQTEFRNLHHGIYGLNTFGKTRTLECTYSVFQNNKIGVFLSNYINPIILDNEFRIASTKGGFGIYLLTSTGYVVENNSFTDVNGYFGNLNAGLMIIDSGPFYNEIYRNNFSRLTYGGVAQRKNADDDKCRVGLEWLCNTFETLLHSDICLMENSTMSSQQGACATVPAGNMFSHSSINFPNHLDLYNGNLGFVIHYEYHNNINSYPNLVPLAFTGHPFYTEFTLVPCPQNYDRNSCLRKSTGKPVGDGAPIDPGIMVLGLPENMDYQDYADLASAYADQLALLQTSQLSELSTPSEELDALRSEMRTFWHELTMTYQWDTLGVISTEQMTSLLTTYQPESSERFASAFLGAANANWVSTYAQANASETSLPVAVNGTLPTEIPSYFESDFFSNLGNVDALNALYIANNAIYNPYDVEDLPIFGNSLGKSNGDPKSLDSEDVEEAEEELSRLVVTPNPFRDNVKFDLSAYTFKGSNNRLELYDLLGKKVYVQTLTENQNLAVIQGADLPVGVILYTLYVNGESVESGKVVRVK